MFGRNTMITKVVRDIESGAILARRLRWTDHDFAQLMGVRLGSVFTTTFIGPLPANANETVILTTGPIGQAVDNAAVLLFWFSTVTPGTTTSGVVYRIRRGTTTGGAAIGASTWAASAAAGVQNTLAGVYVDTPGVVAAQQYSLTLSTTAATVAGAFNDGCLIAMVL